MQVSKDAVKDYYNILGVPTTASQEEIKAAWKKLVKEWHPDVCRRADAQSRFIEFSEAYHVLQDEYARRRYDYLLQGNLHDLIYYRNRRDFRNCQDEARDQAEPFAAPPPEYLVGLMLQTAISLAQYMFLSWINAFLLYPFGYLDSSENIKSS
ncbi:MAG: DnaJ domain-containing protein [Syntrophomonadaceae bacterium]